MEERVMRRRRLLICLLTAVAASFILTGCEFLVRSGELSIVSRPSGLIVAVDDKPVLSPDGFTALTTPATFELPVGFHVVELKLDNETFYGPESVEIVKNELTELVYQPGALDDNATVSEDEYSEIPEAAIPSGGVIIDGFEDLSDSFPRPRNQGIQNSCTAFAVGYAYRSYLEYIERGWNLTDEAHLFSPAFIYNQINRGVDKGCPIPHALTLLRDTGAATLETMPYNQYDFTAQPSDEAFTEAGNFRISSYGKITLNIFGFPRDFLTDFKTSLEAGIPIIVQLWTDMRVADDGFFYGMRDTIDWVPDLVDLDGIDNMRHAIGIVGYDDTEQRVKFINSWSTWWGDDGFGYIPYSNMTAVIKEAYVAEQSAKAATPGFSPEPGSYDTPIDVEISCSTPNASIRYTADGSNPTTTHGIEIDSGSMVPVAASTTLKAIAYRDGMESSFIAVGTYEIQDGSTPDPAVNPSPANGASNTSVSTDLGWSDGGGATSYGVYFGTDSTPDLGEFQGNQTATSFALPTLNYGTTYYWQIDSANAAGPTAGNVWYFTTGDSPGITVSQTSGLVTTESGGTDTFTVVLDSQPLSSVTIGLSSNDTTEGTVSPGSLTFTTSNWSSPRTVVVTGVNDFVVDGDINFTIVTGAASSSDPNYNGLNPPNVSARNYDNDSEGNETLVTSKDCTTSEGAPDLNHNGDSLAVLNSGGVSYASLVYFNLGAIPSGATIVSAYLDLYCHLLTGPVTLRIGRLPQSPVWYESTVTWNSMPFAQTPPSLAYFPGVAEGAWSVFGVTAFVAAWHQDTYDNAGFQLWTESSDAAMFRCSEYSASYAPRLRVNWRRLQ